jgi:hypothetical protein
MYYTSEMRLTVRTGVLLLLQLQQQQLAVKSADVSMVPKPSRPRNATPSKPTPHNRMHGGVPCMPRPAAIKPGMAVNFTYLNRDESLCAATSCDGVQVKTEFQGRHCGMRDALVWDTLETPHGTNCNGKWNSTNAPEYTGVGCGITPVDSGKNNCGENITEHLPMVFCPPAEFTVAGPAGGGWLNGTSQGRLSVDACAAACLSFSLAGCRGFTMSDAEECEIFHEILEEFARRGAIATRANTSIRDFCPNAGTACTAYIREAAHIATKPRGERAASHVKTASAEPILNALLPLLLPQPRRARATGGAGATLTRTGWTLAIAGALPAESPAARLLARGLGERFGVSLAPASPGSGKVGVTSQLGSSSGTITLTVAAGTAPVGPARDKHRTNLALEAYVLHAAPGNITIAANAPAGAHHGVITLLQLLTAAGALGAGLALPGCALSDWPDLGVRAVYWDDNHHVEHLPALKAAISNAADYKANVFAIKLNGHFAFASAPAAVEPYALDAAELAELAAHAADRHVRLAPYLDGPGHASFLLKHEEYARHRAFNDSNFELCVAQKEAVALWLAMADELASATNGSGYFVFSTDEAYYVGLANTSRCSEAAPGKSQGQVLAEFATAVYANLAGRGLTVQFWGEFPMQPADIRFLPTGLVNGETYGAEFDAAFAEHGIRSLVYTSTEGVELLFPRYYAPGQGAAGQAEAGRVPGMRHSIAAADAAADLHGVFVAGWGDNGLHPETFWLGYGTGVAAGWAPPSNNGSGADADTASRAFYVQHHGLEDIATAGRVEAIYRDLSAQAAFYASSWDVGYSTARPEIWGGSRGPGKYMATDQSLPLLPVPVVGEGGGVRLVAGPRVGLGRIVALYYCSSTLHQIHSQHDCSVPLFLKRQCDRMPPGLAGGETVIK